MDRGGGASGISVTPGNLRQPRCRQDRRGEGLRPRIALLHEDQIVARGCGKLQVVQHGHDRKAVPAKSRGRWSRAS